MPQIRGVDLMEFFDLPGDRAIVHALIAADRALHILAPALVDCLRLAGDMDGGEIYDLLAEAEIIRREPYDPENAAHAEARGELDLEGTLPGDEIWILTDFGKQFT